MANLSNWGNRLHSGETTYPIIAQRKRWFAVSAALVLIAILVLVFKGLTLGIDFKGGTEYTLAEAGSQGTTIARDLVLNEFPASEPSAFKAGPDIRVQLGTIDQTQVAVLASKLADAYDIPVTEVSSSFIGPSWGADVSGKAVKGLVVFLVLVTAFMALYFRTWRMAVAGLVALLHDLVFTVGIYALSGFTVTPASVIGFLTILGFSLYDTVVVFDKVKENTAEVYSQHRFTYDELTTKWA